jgi:hypothetical protein
MMAEEKVEDYVENDGMDDGGDDDAAGDKRARVGRKVDEVWGIFTDDRMPWRQKSSTCKHCNGVINVEKKKAYAERHLKNCSVYQQALRDKTNALLPEFMRSPAPRKLTQVPINDFCVPNMTVPQQKAFGRQRNGASLYHDVSIA